MPDPTVDPRIRKAALELVHQGVEDLLDQLTNPEWAAMASMQADEAEMRADQADTPEPPSGPMLADIVGVIFGFSGPVGYYDRWQRSWSLTGQPLLVHHGWRWCPLESLSST